MCPQWDEGESVFSRSGTPTLEQAVALCLNTPEFMQEYRRLTGASLLSGTPIENMVDEATGRTEAEAGEFLRFVLGYVWLPVVVR